MLKTLRNKAPFIMLGYCIIFTILSYFDVYKPILYYLGDILGYSLFTNAFMLSVYMNKRYCTATKITVWCLIFLNILNLVWIYYGIDGRMYDLSIMFLTVLILLIYKIES